MKKIFVILSVLLLAGVVVIAGCGELPPDAKCSDLPAASCPYGWCGDPGSCKCCSNPVPEVPSGDPVA